jgi:capsular polysaccharide biosynthesis protein
MELRRYIYLIRRHLVLLLVATVASAAAGWAIASRSPRYSASTTIFVGSRHAGGSVDTTNQAQLNQTLATYSDLIANPIVTQKALGALHVNRSPQAELNNVVALVEPNSNLIQLTVIDSDPSVAQKLANGISDIFVSQVNSPKSGGTVVQPGTTPSVPIFVFQAAVLPLDPLPTGAARTTILAGAFGLVASFLLVMLAEHLNLTVKSAEELERRLELPLLGIVPEFSGAPPPLRRSTSLPGDNS